MAYYRDVAYHIRQEKFEGPLELLLDLIEKEKIAISEISLARVAEEYLAYVRTLSAPDPEELAGFLVVAVQLILIKSRSLLPGLAVPAEEEQSIAELEERLRVLQRLREAARRIKEIEGFGRRMYGRDAYHGMAPVFYPPEIEAGVLGRTSSTPTPRRRACSPARFGAW